LPSSAVNVSQCFSAHCSLHLRKWRM